MTTLETKHEIAREPVDGDWQAHLARAHLAAIIESSEDAIVSKTLEGIVNSWNHAAERLFGWTAEEMIGQSILKVIPEDLHPEEGEILRRLRSGERLERYETTRVHKDGHLLEVSLTISPIRDRGGQIVGAAKIAHDITARRRAERLIREESRALEALNRVGQAVAAQLDLDRIVQIVTDAATELSGAAFGAFFYNVNDQGDGAYWLYTLSGAPREAFAQFPMPRCTEVFAPTFRGEGIVRSDDIRKDPRYGKTPPFNGMPPGHLPVCSYLAVPVVSRTSEVLGGLFFGHQSPGVFTDRSERLVGAIASQAAIGMDNARLFQTLKDRERELNQVVSERETLLDSERAARSQAERLSRMKDEFLTTLSHELRTPLNAIQGWAELLRRTELTTNQKQGVATIDRNARAQTRIIDDLLDMSRIISGKIHLEVQPLSLQDLIQTGIETVRQTAEAKGVRLQSLLDTNIGPVRGDPNRLQQVMWNLLSNAVKFTPRDGRVSVVLQRVNSHVEIVVEDSGIGIRPDFLPFVFDRFRQADPSSTRRYGGLGLGLSISKNLVELHGGTIRVKSTGPDQGSTFTVVLPLLPVDSSGQRDSSVAVPEFDPLDGVELPRLDGCRVLVVDDEPDGRGLIARILEDCGAHCVCAGDVREALGQLAAHAFDIVLSDIGMPDKDGYELMREMRSRESDTGRTVPAIAVTAYARAEDRQRSLLAGYQMHLSKPVEARELIAAIASILRIRHQNGGA
jgi:PAS domain S-box-containing protein